MKKNLLISSASLIILFSCTSIETNVNPNSSYIDIKVDENEKFLNYLNDDWQNTLNDNPLFASYTGDKRQNNKISSNNIDKFNKNKKSDEQSLKLLRSIDESKLTEENKLNYKLKEFDLLNSIGTREFPTYYLRLNQRGGIQSFYETGNRLVYTSKQDYFDWLERLRQFESNIYNAVEINKEGLSKGHTQPKLVTRGVIAQLKSIIESNIDSNPYMKVFLEADDSFFTETEKANLINEAKNLVQNKINPAYEKLFNFFISLKLLK